MRRRAAPPPPPAARLRQGTSSPWEGGGAGRFRRGERWLAASPEVDGSHRGVTLALSAAARPRASPRRRRGPAAGVPLPPGSAPPGVLLPSGSAPPGVLLRSGSAPPGSRCRRGQRRRGPAAAGVRAAGILLPGSCCRRGQSRRGPAAAGVSAAGGPAAVWVSAAGGPAAVGVSAAGVPLPPGSAPPGSCCRRGSCCRGPAAVGDQHRRRQRRRGSRCRRGPAARTGARWRGPLGGLSVGKGCPEAAVPISERSGPPREQQPAGEQGGRRPPACLRLGSVTGVCPGPHAGGKRGPPWEWTFPNLRLLCVIGRSRAGSWNCSDSLFLRPRASRGFVHLPARSCSSGGRQLSSLPDTLWFPIEKDEEFCLHSVLTSSQWAGAGGPAPTPLSVPCQCTWPYHCYFACLTCDGSKTVTSAATSTRWDPYLPVTANEMRDAQLNQSAPLLGPRTGIGTTILSRLAVRSEME
ncbi:basic proline-rich protein-like [Mustela lutreola]|uniref:basic proline-rich protein-like n=1 Tax=Mustela lutreola TaxID=9666 RepID=UPI0027971BBB|nr:basic proline-rich protein-like [Mustela lutreola]